MSDDEHMQRAIALAERAVGWTSPNPPVGCVLVRNKTIVGEGWHRGPGTDHAEVDALKQAKEQARGATAFVTLEPCNHYGNTPPCTKALIDAGVAEIVFGLSDPNPLASGGAATLRAAGVSVRQGGDEAAARALVRPWLHSLTSQRPFVTAKFAMTLDGRTATRTGDSKWITGPEARAHGHLLRQRADAILVGIETVLADDPSLDPRVDGCDPAPLMKIVLDSGLRTPETARLFRSPGPVVIFTTDGASMAREEVLTRAGAEIVRLLGAERPDIAAVLDTLAGRGMQSVLIEGGGTVLGAAFDAGVVDEVAAFIGPRILGGGRAAVNGQGPLRLADAASLTDLDVQPLGDSILFNGLINRTEMACSQAS